MPPAVRQADHIGIKVADMPAAVRFYHEVLGLPMAGRQTMPSGNELVFLRLGSAGLVELIGSAKGYEPAQPVPPTRAGLQHYCFEVDNLDPWLERLREQGVPLISGPSSFDLPYDHCRALFVADPDGTPVELIERRPKATASPETSDSAAEGTR